MARSAPLSADALTGLNKLVSNSGRKSSVQLARSFARQEGVDGEPPLAMLLRQGEVALKLYLTLVMMTRKSPHEVYRDTSSEFFACSLETQKVGTAPESGVRRVNRALAQLENQEFIQRCNRPGRWPGITVKHWEDEDKLYISIPLGLWKKGWIVAMSGRALAVYVALRLAGVSSQGEFFHIRPYVQVQYGLSKDTWRRGVQELVTLGVLEVSMGKVDDQFVMKRDRRLYRLVPGVIEDKKPSLI